MQLNLYVPEEMGKMLRQKARMARASLSQYVTEILAKQESRETWRAGFFTETLGGWRGNFPEVEREPLQERETL